MTDTGRIVAVTGASSGIGLAAARLFRDRGDKVYCLSRTDPKEPGITFIHTDVTDEASVNAANELSDRWQSFMKYGVLVNDLGHAVEITSSIAEIGSFAQESNEELYAACDRAQAQIGLFKAMQVPTFWKIL